MSSDKQDFKPVKVKLKSSKNKSMKYISGDLLYSGVNLFGKLSEIYLDKIKNGEMYVVSSGNEYSQSKANYQTEYSTPSLNKKDSTSSVASNSSVAGSSVLQGSQVFQMKQEVMSLFRKLQKKDGITKVKALKSLQAYVKNLRENEVEGFEYAEQGSEISQLLTFFLYHFERIITYEAEKSVRESTHEVLGEFLKTFKRNFAQHIINLFPLWYISFYDTAAEIRTKSKQNFMSTFKTPEIRSTLFRRPMENKSAVDSDSGTTISQNYLYFIQEKIMHFEMLLTEDMTTLEKPQRQSIFDRIISGCLESLCDSFDTFATCKEDQKEESWRDEDTKEYISQLIEILNLDSDEFPTIYKFLGSKFTSPVRAACLRMLEKMSDYIISNDQSNKKVIEKHIHKLANSVFSAIADQSSLVQKQLWKSVLYNFWNKFDDSIWLQIDIKKGLLPQLHTCLKNAGFGAHTDLYKNFVAFISIFPVFNLDSKFETTCKITNPNNKKKAKLEQVEEVKNEGDHEETESKDKKKKKQKKQQNAGAGEKTVKNSFSVSEKLNVMFDIMKSLFGGINVEESIAFCDEIINSYYDTMSFLYLKRIIPAAKTLETSEDPKIIQALHKKSTQSFMFPVTEFLKNNDPALKRSLYSLIPHKFATTLKFLSEKGISSSDLSALLLDLQETLIIGLQRSPQNAILLLSSLLTEIPSTSSLHKAVQDVCCSSIDTLYESLDKMGKTMTKGGVEEFSYTSHVFKHLSSALLKNVSILSPVFDILVKAIKMIKSAIYKFIESSNVSMLEDTQEFLWLVLISRLSYLKTRETDHVKTFLAFDMLDYILKDIQVYKHKERYQRTVLQYLRPEDWVVEKGQAKKKGKKGEAVQEEKAGGVFREYEEEMKESQRFQEAVRALFPEGKVFKKVVESYVGSKEDGRSTIVTEETVKYFLETSLNELEKDGLKALYLATLTDILSSFLLYVPRTDEELYPIWNKICKNVVKLMLSMQQNLTSCLEIWYFIGKILLTKTQHNLDNEFLSFLENELMERVGKLIGLSNYQEQEFNKEIMLLKNYLNILPREVSTKASSMSKILLKEEHFEHLSKNCLVLKIFQHTFLAGGLGFNVDDLALIKDEHNNFKYIWLVGELLNSERLPSLAGYASLKNQIKGFWESEILPLILRQCCSDSSETLFTSLIAYLTKKAVESSPLYAKTLGNIVNLIITPPEGLFELVADFNNWKELLEITIIGNVDIVIQAEDSNDSTIRRRIEIIKVISEAVKRLLYSTESYQGIISKVIKNLNLEKESNIILFNSMIDDNRFEKTGAVSEDEKSIRATESLILAHISQFLDKKITSSASLDSILESLNLSLKRYGLTHLTTTFNITLEHISLFLLNSLEFIISSEQSIENSKSSNPLNTIGISLLQFLKRTLSSLHSSSPVQANQIINSLLSYCSYYSIKASKFTEKVLKLRSMSKNNLKGRKKNERIEQKEAIEEETEEVEYEFIEWISDILSAVVPYVHEGLDEERWYELLGCGIESVQKASYLVLTQFYQNFIPPLRFQYEEAKELTEEELKMQIESEFEKDKEEEDKKEESKEEKVGGEEEEKKNELDKVKILNQKRIKGEADKNVSLKLLEIIEKAPNFQEDVAQNEEGDQTESEDEFVNEGFMNIQGSSTLLDDKLMNKEVYTYLLAWNSMLNKINNAKMKLKFEQDHEYLRVINSLQEFLTMNQHVYEMFLIIIVAYLPSKGTQKYYKNTLIDCKPEWVDLNDQTKIDEFALYSMYNFMTNFPSLAREYYHNCDRRIYDVVYPIISKLISPAIMENEIRKIEISQADLNAQNLTFTLFKSTQEILADYREGEVEVQLKLKIPNEYPLKSVDVKCTKQLKIPDNKLRRWMLSIKKTISSQNGDFISAILLWKSNIEKEIEGVEDCLICYCTVHVIDKSLPKLACKNCNNKFHAHCIKKWFAESQKSKCPMCQSFFW